MSICLDRFIYFFRLIRNDKKSAFLIPFVKHMENLRRGKLKQNRIQSFIPAEEEPCYNQHTCIPQKNVIPCVDPLLFREEDSDKVGSSAGCMGEKAKADGTAVDDATKNTDQKRIGGDRKAWENIGEDAG